MTISSRNRRATVYPYSSANDGGFMTSQYGPARGSYFVRMSPVRGAEMTSAGQAAARETAVVEFADTVVIGKNDMLSIDGVQWKVSAVTFRRSLDSRCTLVDVFRNDDEPAVVTL